MRINQKILYGPCDREGSYNFIAAKEEEGGGGVERGGYILNLIEIQ